LYIDDQILGGPGKPRPLQEAQSYFPVRLRGLIKIIAAIPSRTTIPIRHRNKFGLEVKVSKSPGGGTGVVNASIVAVGCGVLVGTVVGVNVDV
jgi:hypothetical protein